MRNFQERTNKPEEEEENRAISRFTNLSQWFGKSQIQDHRFPTRREEILETEPITWQQPPNVKSPFVGICRMNWDSWKQALWLPGNHVSSVGLVFLFVKWQACINWPLNSLSTLIIPLIYNQIFFSPLPNCIVLSTLHLERNLGNHQKTNSCL